MSWVILGIAVITEVMWALSLKLAQLQTGWWTVAVPVALSFINMGLLSWAMRGLPAGTAYAVWTGLGAVGVAIGGVMLFGEQVSALRFLFMGIIVVGVVGMKLVPA